MSWDEDRWKDECPELNIPQLDKRDMVLRDLSFLQHFLLVAFIFNNNVFIMYKN